MTGYKRRGELSADSSAFRPGHNCWRINRFYHAAMLIDCANFYRALHEAISKAKHSVFIVGWDIDSRIRLLRGEDEKNSSMPSVAGEFLAWKAEQHPDLQIYLLRWDASLAFLQQRELLARRVWEFKTPPNVHVWLDNTIPAGGSHHQKIILVDDEVVFTGGMDIAPQRWDERAHRPHEPERFDSDGSYGPYHDIQVVMHGPVVRDFAELVRWRWKHAAGFDAIPIRKGATANPESFPAAWPKQAAEISFSNMRCAIARTIPWMGNYPEKTEVREMYIDLISRAEKFLYMENQFFTCSDVASAINAQLKAQKSLKVLLVSSYNPQGQFEREGMWAGRIDFMAQAAEGIEENRIQMVYPVIFDENGEEFYKRIHAKVMAVDNTHFDIASSNINRRSMAMDTECDFVVEATDRDHRRAIEHVRNDLIAEHSGLEEAQIEWMIEEGRPVTEFIGCSHRRCLRAVKDEDFNYQSLKKVASAVADPDRPLLPHYYSLNPGERIPMHNPRKDRLLIASLLLLAGLAMIGLLSSYAEWIEPEKIRSFLDATRGTPWAFPLVCLVYVAGGLVMFPVTVLSLITAAVFGPLWGPLYAMAGALLSAAILFGIGHFAGLKGIRRLIGEKVRKIDAKLQDKGVLGIVTIRLVPIAPYSVVNLAAGISSIRFLDFIAGTFLGLLPGLIAKGFVGDSLVQAFINPSRATFAYVAGGILFWVVLAGSTQIFINRFRKK